MSKFVVSYLHDFKKTSISGHARTIQLPPLVRVNIGTVGFHRISWKRSLGLVPRLAQYLLRNHPTHTSDHRDAMCAVKRWCVWPFAEKNIYTVLNQSWTMLWSLFIWWFYIIYIYIYVYYVYIYNIYVMLYKYMIVLLFSSLSLIFSELYVLLDMFDVFFPRHDKAGHISPERGTGIFMIWQQYHGTNSWWWKKKCGWAWISSWYTRFGCSCIVSPSSQASCDHI